MSIEAMKQALEALEETPIEYDYHGNPADVEFGKKMIKAITALRQAIEQAEKQEPFGYFQLDLRLDAWVMNRHSNKGTPFYTTPPQRKPLTEEELIECERLASIRHRKHIRSIRGQQITPADEFLWHYARAIEAAHGIK